MEKAIAGIIEYLHKSRGCDYSGHHTAMLFRRIHFRIEVTKTENINNYLQFLINNQEEADHLIDALSITVSMFFRNPLAYEIIAHQLLPMLYYAKMANGNREFRFWSAGCANGEEPYSLAILIKDFLAKESEKFSTSIFGTDLEKKNIQFAKRGVYGPQSVNEVKLGILNRYFKQEGDSYKLNSEIRQSVNYSVYDLLNSTNFAPPESVFGSFDLILCRNVLIYYQPEYQDKIFYKLHRSLQPGGFLVLGEAERLSDAFITKFKEINRIAKVYQKI